MKPFDQTQKKFIWISVLISLLYFVAFIFPNKAASENIKMVAVFEPDESVPLPYLLRMIEPADSPKQALINFAFYDYYFYGFPYFAASALSLLPLVPLGLIENISLVMVMLRQMISVLPILLTALFLVHIQTGFRSYKSVVLLLLLLSIPAVVQNNFWWHPDSMVTFLSVVVIWLLNRDDLKFGPGYYLAAVTCGFTAGTKGIGFYFFLTVFVYLLLGYFSKKVALKKLLFHAVGFLLCMAFGYWLANPILIYRGVRNDYFTVMNEQSDELYFGYWVLYAKGFLASLPLLTEYYGNILFLALAVLACGIGIVKDKNRLLNILIITWLIPLSVLVFWITNFKFQYWIPVALPLFSTMVRYLPDKISLPLAWRDLAPYKDIHPLPQVLISLAVVVQLASFVKMDIPRYLDFLNRAENEPALRFYDLAVDALKPLPEKGIFVYHDVRMYFPRTERWATEAKFKPLDYEYIRARDFEVVMVMHQRIKDYLNEGVVGVNPEEFALSQAFYRDVRMGKMTGYQLVFQDDFGLVFVRDDVYQEFYLQK